MHSYLRTRTHTRTRFLDANWHLEICFQYSASQFLQMAANRMHEVLGSSKIQGETPTNFSYPHSSTQPQVTVPFHLFSCSNTFL